MNKLFKYLIIIFLISIASIPIVNSLVSYPFGWWEPIETGTLHVTAHLDLEEISVNVIIMGKSFYFSKTTPFTITLPVGDYSLTASYKDEILEQHVTILKYRVVNVDFKFSVLPPPPPDDLELPEDFKEIFNKYKFVNMRCQMELWDYKIHFYNECEIYPGWIQERTAIIGFNDSPDGYEDIPHKYNIIFAINWVDYTECKWHIYISHIGYDAIKIYKENVLVGILEEAGSSGSISRKLYYEEF